MARFTKCPKCGSKDIEISEIFAEVDDTSDAGWGCWDCNWLEKLNQEEKDARIKGEDLG
jgi:predicted nucleic-acid-binding Zn-ribbon protein